MKILKVITLIYLSAIICFCIGQAAVAPVPPSGEFVINTSKSTNLNCDYLRLVGQKLVLDDKFTNWTISIGFEAWATNGTPIIVSRGSLKLTMPQLNTLLNAGNPRNALKTQILLSAGLIEKP